MPVSVKFKVDTAAQANILPAKYFDTLPHKQPLIKSTQRLKTYCGSKIPVRGVCQLNCKHQSNKAKTLLFFIVETDSIPVLGFRPSIDLNVIKLVLKIGKADEIERSDIHAVKRTEVNKIINSYNDVFQGIGKLDG